MRTIARQYSSDTFSNSYQVSGWAEEANARSRSA